MLPTSEFGLFICDNECYLKKFSLSYCANHLRQCMLRGANSNNMLTGEWQTQTAASASLHLVGRKFEIVIINLFKKK